MFAGLDQLAARSEGLTHPLYPPALTDESRTNQPTTTAPSESAACDMKDVIAIIEGRRVFHQLKYEGGVHRVQRVPATEQQGRVHTSAVTVAVLPEAEDVDVKIEAKDLRIDTFCSSGPGGQSVN